MSSEAAKAKYPTGKPIQVDEHSRIEGRGLVLDAVRAAYDQGRIDALREAIQAHFDLHRVYGSTSACHGGVGGQVMTPHCAEICDNMSDPHRKELDAWNALVGEVLDHDKEARS